MEGAAIRDMCPATQLCPHAPHCVGCALIGTPYTGQLEQKRARVLAALAEYPRLAGVAVGTMSGSPRVFGYRNQAKLVARRGGRGLRLGIYRPGSHQVVDIGGCPVQERDYDFLRIQPRKRVPLRDRSHLCRCPNHYRGPEAKRPLNGIFQLSRHLFPAAPEHQVPALDIGSDLLQAHSLTHRPQL